MPATLKTHFSNWLFRPKGAEAGPVVLTQRRVFILPTRAGMAFAMLLLLMLVGSLNYNLSLGYVLTFLLGGMGVVSILHTFRNLAGLSVRPGKTEPVFAGQTARFSVCLENNSATHRYSIVISPSTNAKRPDQDADACYTDAPAGKTSVASLALPAPKRGLLKPGRMTLETVFPLGLFRAWSYVELDTHCLVYPKPDAADAPPPTFKPSPGEGIEHGLGTDDFAGLRPYHSGDSPRHIAWKILARGSDTLLTKQFSGRAAAELWLDWNDIENIGTEARLSRLTRWVLDCDAGGLSYGLRLPGKNIPPANGAEHRQQCLETLALFDT